MASAETIQKAVARCAEPLNLRFAKSNDKVVFVVLLKGALYAGSDFSKSLLFEHSVYIIEASSYFDKQTSDHKLEILSVIKPEKFNGRKVIILDELFDNGDTMKNVVDIISKETTVVRKDITTVAIFKKDKTTHTVPDVYGLKVPDVWLVGYGLDDQQTKRNWTSLWACPKAEGVPKTDADEIFTSRNYLTAVQQHLIRLVNSERNFFF